MAEKSTRQTRNPEVLGSGPPLVTCWICSQSLRVQILGPLVNSQLVASCQLGFLILLCSKYLSGLSACKLAE